MVSSSFLAGALFAALAAAPNAEPPLTARLPLAFDDVLVRAGTLPRLEAQDAALSARARREGEISPLAANPTVQVLPGWRLPGASRPGFEIQGSVSQSLDLGGLGSARKAAAVAERQQLGAARRALALALRLEAARVWLALWSQQTQLERIEVELALARDLAAGVQRAVTLGAALQTDAAEADLFAETLRRFTIDAEGRVYEQAISLAGALGLDGAPLPIAEGPPPPVVLPDPPAWTAFIARASELPAVAAERLSARAAEARAREAAAEGSWRIAPTVTAQWERPNDVLVFGGLSVQPTLFANNARALGVTEAEVAATARNALQAGVDARREVRLALHEVEHSREVEAQIREQIVPTAESWVDRAGRRFDAGETDVFVVLRARQRLAEARVTLVEAEERRRWSEMKAWLLLASLSDAPGRP